MARKAPVRFAAVIALLAAGCGGSSDAQAELSNSASSVSDTTTTTTTTVLATSDPDEALPQAGTIQFDLAGPVSEEVIWFDDAGYFAALGVDAVRVTRQRNADDPNIIEFDRSGGLYTYFGNQDGWKLDGRWVAIENERWVDALYAGWMVEEATLKIATEVDVSVTEAVARVGPTEELGFDSQLHQASPAAFLEHEQSSSPEWWDWNSATFEVITNAKGAVLRVEEVTDYVWNPHPSAVDPSPPRNDVETVTYTVEAIAEITPFPGVPEAADRSERTTLDVLRLAGRGFDAVIPFEPGVSAAMVTEELIRNDSPFLRHRIPIAEDVDDATTEVMGLVGGVFLLQNEDGRWFCLASRADAWENRFPENPDGTFGDAIEITASGSDPDMVVRDCQNQRDDLREAQGLSAWNR